MKQIPAKEITRGDVLVRFGHRLEVIATERIIHPATKNEAVRITHQAGIVHYSPDRPVEIQ